MKYHMDITLNWFMLEPCNWCHFNQTCNSYRDSFQYTTRKNVFVINNKTNTICSSIHLLQIYFVHKSISAYILKEGKQKKKKKSISLTSIN